MDPKTYEPPQPPLIAQLPPVQMSILPQHIITSGTEKSCIRLRGLPYEAKVEHILQFLDDFAKHIVYQGVHLVFNAQVSNGKFLLLVFGTILPSSATLTVNITGKRPFLNKIVQRFSIVCIKTRKFIIILGPV